MQVLTDVVVGKASYVNKTDVRIFPVYSVSENVLTWVLV